MATSKRHFPGFRSRVYASVSDEGSFLYMPTTMPHASIGEATDVLQLQNKLISSIPEVDMVVGKLGRVDSPLDPAPISMIETNISYKSEYITDKEGHRVEYAFDQDKNDFIRDEKGVLIEDPGGRPFRQWRDEVLTPDDIWKEILAAADIPGTTSAPQAATDRRPNCDVAKRYARAPMGIKIRGPDLETIEKVVSRI